MGEERRDCAGRESFLGRCRGKKVLHEGVSICAERGGGGRKGVIENVSQREVEVFEEREKHGILWV